MNVQQAYEVFLADRQVNGCTQATLASYRSSVGPFVEFVQGGNIDVCEVAQFVTPYFLSLHERKLSQATHHTYFQGVKIFTRFLHSENYVENEIRLPNMKSSASAIQPLSPAQMRKALSCFNTKRFIGLPATKPSCSYFWTLVCGSPN